MKYPKLRELREAIKALIKGPYTSRFPKEAHKPFDSFRGKPYFHEEDCTGCTACVQVCPAGALEFTDELRGDIAVRKLTIHWDICIACGQCQVNCLTSKGIILSQEFDLSTTGKREELKQSIEKELVLCDICNDPASPRDQYKWVTKKLGILSFANSSLMLFYLKALSLALKSSRPPSGGARESSRADRIKILCPRCRREAVVRS
jgi:hydrogenase-4 component H